MSKSFLTSLVLAGLIAPLPAFAQKAQKAYKRSCDEVCLERCANAAYKSYCIQNCPQRCMLYRQQKKYQCLASAPFPKFVIHCGTLSHELRKQRGTSKYMILVPLFDLKFLNELAGTAVGTSNRRH